MSYTIFRYKVIFGFLSNNFFNNIVDFFIFWIRIKHRFDVCIIYTHMFHPVFLLRMRPSDDEAGYRQLFADLLALEDYRRELLAEALKVQVD